MNTNDRHLLARIVRNARIDKKLSAREVARRAGVDVGVVTKLELCQIGQPRIESIRALAQVLSLSITDLFATLHWLQPDELPAFRPYMRAKFGQLPEGEMEYIERFVNDIVARYGQGPLEHEDEHDN